jgi:hypothetical protein
MLLRALIGLATLLCLGVAGQAQSPPSLERALVRAAPSLIQMCKKSGYQNIGVLKFVTFKDGRENRFSDNAGTINLTLARQLELAMILANDASNPIGIVENANAVAAGIAGANHLKKDGRQKLFDAKYPLAWGNANVQVDAFFTGTVAISSDLQTLEITLMSFDRAKNELNPCGDSFKAANTAARLAEMGESFSTRGAFDGGKVEQRPKAEQQILAEAAKLKDPGAPNPFVDPGLPIRLEIRYDDQVITPKFEDGKLVVREPMEGQKVKFILKRNIQAGNFGIVLKVNGENTLFKQRLPDLHCRKWLSFPGDGPIVVEGYQIDAKRAEEFRVLSIAESKEREMNYGADVGTITMTVFAARKAKEKGRDLTDETQYTEAVEKAKLPDQKSANYAALQQKLLSDANRGLIGEGQKIGSETVVVKFDPDPTPVTCLTIVYRK